jgi:hypothetical protein
VGGGAGNVERELTAWIVRERVCLAAGKNGHWQEFVADIP